MRRVLALLAAFSLAPAALAGSLAEVTQVSFSPDGRFALAVVMSRSDAEDTDRQEVRVVDTSSGREVWRGPGALNTHWATLQRKYGFRRFSTPRQRTPLPAVFPSAPGPLTARVGQTVVYPVRLWTRVTAVQVRVRPAGPSAPQCRGWGVQPASYALSVSGQATAQGKAGECAFAYGLGRVDVQGNRALFALNVFTPMTGGPDMQVLLVGATLK